MVNAAPSLRRTATIIDADAGLRAESRLAHAALRAARALKSLAASGARPLAALLFAAGAVWLSGEIADGVLEGETRSVEERLLLLVRSPGDTSDPVGPPRLKDAVATCRRSAESAF